MAWYNFRKGSKCFKCRAPLEEHKRGYHHGKRRLKLCADCSIDNSTRQMILTGRAKLYRENVVPGETELVEWKSAHLLRFKPIHKWSRGHNWWGVVGKTYWFIGPDGHEWWGYNFSGKYSVNDMVYCRRTKKVKDEILAAFAKSVQLGIA